MGAVPGCASCSARWAACPCSGQLSYEGMWCLSHLKVNPPHYPHPTVTRRIFLALSASMAGPGEPHAAGRELGLSGCHGRHTMTPIS